MTQIQTAKLSDSLRNIAASAEMEGLIFSSSLQEMCLSVLAGKRSLKDCLHLLSLTEQDGKQHGI